EAARPRRAAAPSLPPDLAKRVVYESEHLLGIDKPAATPVHGNHGLLARLLPYLRSGADKSVSFRPGPLHRLDRNTSGLMLFPKSLAGSQRVSDLLRRRKLAKGYIALLGGHLEHDQWWEDSLVRDRRRGVTRVVDAGGGTGAPGGRGAPGGTGAPGGRGGEAQPAVAAVRPLAWPRGATLALVYIRTGRTHQIRAQAAAHGHPLIGDRKYGGLENDTGYFLHAAVMLNSEPDEVFPEPRICATEGLDREGRLGRNRGRNALHAVGDCEALSRALAEIMYKDSLEQ
ncbi:MAG: RluA family pseudouridine synthase, partial [Spirochaetota bacterium]